MKKKTIFETVMIMLFLIIMSDGCAASECTEDGYAEYKPVFVDTTKLRDEVYVIDESMVDAVHYENIKFVFEFYDIKYKVVDSKIMVDCKVWEDKDYMMNMTKKAGHKDWLATQKRYCLSSPNLCPSVSKSTLEKVKE